jgi:hypothetical protein
MLPFCSQLEWIDHHVLSVLSLNLDGYIGMVSMTWSKVYGKNLLGVEPRSKGGIIKCVQHVNTLEAGHDIPRESLEKKINDYQLS